MKRGLRSLLSAFIIVAFVLGQIVPAYSKETIQPTSVSGQEELNSLQETDLAAKQPDEVNEQEESYPKEDTVSMFSADDHGNDFNMATPVEEDVEIDGMMESIGDSDYFKFKTSSRGTYVIESTGNINVYGELYNSSKERIEYNNYGGKGNNFCIVYSLDEVSEYYVKVTNLYSNSTGAYIIKITKVSDDHGHNNGNATVIPLETEVQGNISFACDKDVFKFTPKVSGSYVIESFGDTDTKGVLYQIYNNESVGQLTSSNDANSTNKNFYISYELKENTTYSIHVSHQKDSDVDNYGTGAYRIKVYMEETGGFSTTLKIDANKDISGEIKNTGQDVYYKFTPSVTGSYIIESSGTTDVEGYLYNSSKTQLKYSYDSGTDKNFRLAYTMIAGKDYYIRVSGQYYNITGKYIFKVTNISDDCSEEWEYAKEILEGIETKGEINYFLDTDAFKFTPKVSGNYVIESLGDTDTKAILYEVYSNGGLSQRNSNGDANSTNKNFCINHELSANSTYLIVVNHNNDIDIDKEPGTGAYSIKAYMEEGGNYSTAINIVADKDIAGEIKNVGQSVFYKFVPSVTGSYVIESSGTTNLYGYLYDSNKASLKSDSSSGLGTNFRMAVTMIEGNEYYIKVYSSQTGKYSIKVVNVADDYGEDLKGAKEIQQGVEIDGEINYVLDADAFIFTPKVSGNYVMESLGNTDTRAELYYIYNGSSLSYCTYNTNANSTNKNFYIKYGLSANTSYLIVVKHENSDVDNVPGTGAYKIKAYMEEGGDFSTAIKLESNKDVPVEIKNLGQEVYYRFIPSVTGSYVIESSGTGYLHGELFNSSKTSLKSNLYNGIKYNFLIGCTMVAGKEYFIKVRSISGTGKYSIKVTNVSDDCGEEWEDAEEIQVGAEVNGEINYVLDTDTFKFTPKVSGNYVIESLGQTDTKGEIHYKHSNGNVYNLKSNSDANATNKNFCIYHELTANTTYYIVVKHENDDADEVGTGAYRFKAYIEEGGDFSTAINVVEDKDIEGEIKNRGQYVYYKFTPSVTGSYVIESIGNTNVIGYIYNSSRETISYDYNGGIGYNFSFAGSFNVNSEYYIKVFHENYSETGRYNLKIRHEKDDFTNEHTNAVEIKLDSEIKGSIDYGRDTDIFRFNPSEDGIYVFETTGDTDTKGILYNKNSNNNNTYQIASEDLGKSGDNFYLSAKLLAKDTYYIEVSHKNTTDLDISGIGNYGLKVYKGEDKHGNSFDTATEINIGKNIDCSLDYSGDLDYLKFTPSVSGKYTIESDGNADMYSYLYNSKRTQLVFDNNTADGKNFRIVYNLNANETYYLMLSGSNYIPYKVRVFIGSDDYNNDIAGGVQVATGVETTGKINYGGDVDFFRFLPNVEGIYSIRSTGSIPMSVELYDNNRRKIGFGSGNDEGGANFNITQGLLKDTPYFIKLSHNDIVNGTGSYGLIVELNDGKIEDDHRNYFEVATPVSIDTVIQGKINYSKDEDFFVFEASKEGMYILESSGSTNIMGLLYDGNEKYIMKDENRGIGTNFMINTTLKAGEKYYVRVKSDNDSDMGEYSLKFYSVNDDYGNTLEPTLVTIEREKQGKIEYPCDIDVFSFDVNENGPYIIESSADTYCELYNSDKNVIFSNDQSTDSNHNMNLTLSKGKVYYLKVMNKDHKDMDNGGTGIYSVKVSKGTDDHGNDFTLSSLIQTGKVLSGAIESVWDEDFYRFTPSKDGTYGIKSSGGLDLYGYLYNSSKQLVASNDNGGEDENFSIPGELKAGQEYYIKVCQGKYTSRGTYNILVTSDLTPPAVPQNMRIVKGAGGSVTFEWNPSVDNVGTEYYSVYRNGIKVGITTETNYTDTGLAPGIYSYTVKAFDSSFNSSQYSNSISFNSMDEVIPVLQGIYPLYENGVVGNSYLYAKTIPVRIAAKDNVNVAWIKLQTSTDLSLWKDVVTLKNNIYSTSYSVDYDYDVSKLPQGKIYMRAIACDGSLLSKSEDKYVEFMIDRTGPVAPKGFLLKPDTGFIDLTWEKSDDTYIKHYKVYRSESENGQYKDVGENITYLGYRDRNVVQGKTYYYKVCAVDLAGNEGTSTSALFTKPLVDNVAPSIYSFSPSTNSTMPANPKLSVLSADNCKLAHIWVEYRLQNSTDPWKLLGEKDLTEYSETSVFAFNTDGLKEGTYEIRAKVKDSVGLESQYKTVVYKLNILPPQITKVSAVPGGWKVDLSWTQNSEPDFGGYRIYRSTTTGSGYSLLRETTDIKYTDSNLKSGVPYYYVVDAVDQYGNTSRSKEIVVVPTDEDKIKPQANGGDDQVTISGMAVWFDGTMSTDNNKISQYIWNFGDNTDLSYLANPTHRFNNPGTYTVTLTVKDPGGNEASDTVIITVKDSQKVGTMEIKVLDSSSGLSLSGSSVVVEYSDGTMYNATTNGSGFVNLILPGGTYKVYGYKTDYKPAFITVDVVEKGRATATLSLEKGQIVVGETNVKRLNLDEIKSAGIDVNASENQWVYKFEVHLAFENKPLPPHQFNVSGSGQVFDYKPIYFSSGGSGGSYYIYPVAIPVPNHPEVRPTVAYLVIPGEARFLKEFFEVSLILENRADSVFVIKDTEVNLNLPDGLTLAKTRENQSLKVNFGDLIGGDKKELKWIVRGDKKGRYKINADFRGILQPFNEVVKASFTTDEFRVWGDDAFEMHIYAQDEVTKGYPYYVEFELKNVSDISVYYPAIELLEEGKQNYFYAPNQDLASSVEELGAGKSLKKGYYLVPAIDGILNLDKSYVLKTGGNAEIESIIHKISKPENSPGKAGKLTQSSNGKNVSLTWTDLSNETGYKIYSIRKDLMMSKDPYELVALVEKDTKQYNIVENDGPKDYIITSIVNGIEIFAHGIKFPDVNAGPPVVTVYPDKVYTGEKTELLITSNKNGFPVEGGKATVDGKEVVLDSNGQAKVFVTPSTSGEIEVKVYDKNNTFLVSKRISVVNKTQNPTQTQQISNPSFDQNTVGWSLWTQNGAVAVGTRDTSVFDSSPAGYRIDCTNKGTQFNHIQLNTSGLNIEKDKFYELSFRAKTKGGKATPQICLMKKLSPWTYYSKAVNVSIGEEWSTYTVYFRPDTTDTDGRITFFLGNRMTEGSSLYIDSVSFKKFEPVQLISNTNFDKNTSGWNLWNQNGASAIGQRDPLGVYRIDCNSKGSANNQIQFITTGLNIKAGKKYELSFDARGVGGDIEPLIMLMKKDSPWTSYGASSSVKVDSQWSTYKVQFTSSATDPNARITFFLGNRMVDGSKLYMDNISLIELP